MRCALSLIYFKIEKTCATSVSEAASYTIQFHQ